MQKLIDALRVTADRIEKQPMSYVWNHRQHCNCGVLAQTICNLPSDILQYKLYDGPSGRHSTWTEMASTSKTCSETGIPLGVVFTTLREYGLQWEDFHHLEYLNDPAICKRAGLLIEERTDAYENNIYAPVYSNSVNAASYMRAWADMLEEQTTAIKLVQEVEETIKNTTIPVVDRKPFVAAVSTPVSLVSNELTH